MSNQFNISLFPWSKYTNEEHQPVPWHILNFLQKLLSETCHFHKETHQNTHSLPSNSAKKVSRYPDFVDTLEFAAVSNFYNCDPILEAQNRNRLVVIKDEEFLLQR